AAAIRKQSLNAQNDAPASMATVMQLNELGLYQQQQNHLEQAAQYYQQALSQLKLLNKEHSIEQATILGNLGALQLATHDTKAAEASLSESLALYQSLQKRPVEAAGIAGYLGTLYYNKRQFAKAETAFLTAVENLQKTQSATNETLLLALQNIQSLYIAWDKPSKAAQYNQAIQKIKQQLQ
ncbi:tetratricopeptide repeat protein, partial [Methylophaga sp. UBA5088]